MAKILAEVKRLESEGYEFEAAEASFELLVRRHLGQHQPLFELQEYHCVVPAHGRQAVEQMRSHGETQRQRRARIHRGRRRRPGERARRRAAQRRSARLSRRSTQIELDDYKVRIINGQHGTAARTRVLIDSTDGETSWGTVGVCDNIIEASWLALVDSFEFKLMQDTKNAR